MDWKWEFVENLLFFVVLAHPIFAKYWGVHAYDGDLSKDEVGEL